MCCFVELTVDHFFLVQTAEHKAEYQPKFISSHPELKKIRIAGLNETVRRFVAIDAQLVQLLR